MTKAKVKDFSEEIKRYEEMKNFFSIDFETGIISQIRTIINRVNFRKNVCKINNKGYPIFIFKNKPILAHRFIFYCCHSVLYPIIDHENGIRHDNCILNLRGGTQKQNCQNQNKPQSNNTTGFLGVSFFKQHQKYYAQIKIKDKRKFLGLFDTAELAYEAYLTAKRIHHEFCTI